MDSLYIRYASALLSLAKDENKVSSYKKAMNELLVYFEENDDVNGYLKSYFVSDVDKYKLIDTLLENYDLKSLPSFLKLLVKKHRFNLFKYIEKQFNSLANDELNIHSGIVYSTIPLSEKEMQSIASSISKREKRQVELVNKIDKRLIGGIKIAIDDRVYDGSIKSKLEAMKNSLSERR